MKKKEAVNWIRDIQSGKMNREEMKDKIPFGRMGYTFWYNDKFSLGMEYGAILAIMKIFNLKKTDL